MRRSEQSFAPQSTEEWQRREEEIERSTADPAPDAADYSGPTPVKRHARKSSHERMTEDQLRARFATLSEEQLTIKRELDSRSRRKRA